MTQPSMLKVLMVDVNVPDWGRTEPTWQPGTYEQAVGRALRGPTKIRPSLRKVGRYWTLASLANPVPRSWRFGSRRAAKRYFSNPISYGSPERIDSMFPCGVKSPFTANKSTNAE